MTKKKRELIEILLDNITPDDWPEELPFAAQDKLTLKVFFYSKEPKKIGELYLPVAGELYYIFEHCKLCKHWSKTIVTRDEFVKRWNERNAQNDNKPTSIGRITWNNGKFIFEDFINTETNATTSPAQQEAPTEETKPIQQEVKATDTQVGGNHYTKLAIQPMRYSMENGLDALQHTVIKYVTRFRDKNGIEDLEKAKHCIDMLIEFERNKK